MPASAPTSAPLVIGIAGGSGSGKSTLTRQLLAAVPPGCATVVMQDHYYRDQSTLARDERRKTNYDHPHAFDWPLMVAQVQALCRGDTVQMPQYDFTQDNRAAHTVAVRSAPVLIIEGLFALFDAELCQSLALKVFVDTAADVRFIRRLQRDMAERGRSADSVIHQYLETVRPMHTQYIEPTKHRADVILPHGANRAAVDMLRTQVLAHLGQLPPGASP